MRQILCVFIAIPMIFVCSRLALAAPADGSADAECESNLDCQKHCDRGDSKSCLDLGFGLSLLGGIAGNMDKAIAAFRTACEQGEPDACFELAKLMEVGHGLPPDEATANQLYQRAAKLYESHCQANKADACLGLAGIHVEGRGLPRNQEKSREFSAKACTIDPKECWNMGLSLAYDEPKKKEEAVKFYERACAAGGQFSCGEIQTLSKDPAAVQRAKNHTMEIRRKSLAKDESECSLKGKASACLSAAREWIKGEIVTPDAAHTKDFTARALSALKKECGPPEPDCGLYGSIYEEGLLVAKDKSQAAVIYERGCKMGNGSNCFLAAMTLMEQNTKDSKARLAFARDAACRQFQDADMCREVGKMYHLGDGVLKDEKMANESFGRAIQMYRVACDHPGSYELGVNSGDACVILGIMYREGFGVAVNLEEASELIKRGCAENAISEECERFEAENVEPNADCEIHAEDIPDQP